MNIKFTSYHDMIYLELFLKKCGYKVPKIGNMYHKCFNIHNIRTFMGSRGSLVFFIQNDKNYVINYTPTYGVVYEYPKDMNEIKNKLRIPTYKSRNILK